MFKVRKIIWVGLTLFLINTFPLFYFGKPIDGIVSDDNGIPLEGVVVLLEHHMETTNGHQTNTNLVYLTETLTDKDGKYYFPWWITPRLNILGWRMGSSPSASFFKVGYSFDFILNESKLGQWPSAYVFSDMPKEVVLKTYDADSVDDLYLNWYSPSDSAMRGVCPRFYIPMYTNERDKFIRTINPIREKRGLKLLEGSEYEHTYCN